VRKITKIIPKVWGQEEVIVNLKYCGKILRISPLHQGSLHCHPKKAETFWGFDGRGVIELDGQSYKFGVDDIIDIPAGIYHRFINPDEFCDFVLMEFSSHHDDKDVVRKEKSK